jgi:hypothetical protein
MEEKKLDARHTIEFRDVLPLLHRGGYRELYDAEGDKIDLSNCFDCESQDTLDIVTKIIRKRHPKRGDIYKFAFLNGEEQGGYFFWDGEKAIPPEKNEDGEYFIVPSQFKVPTDFPINHWNESGFTGFTTDDLCYDTSDIKFSMENGGKNSGTITALTEVGFRRFIAKNIMEFLNYKLEEIFTSDLIQGACLEVYYDNAQECHIIMFYGEDEKKDTLAMFLKTGRCRSAEDWEEVAENSISDRKRLQNIIRKINNKIPNRERCVYVQYM